MIFLALTKTVTITFGWWLIPAIITLICLYFIFGIWFDQKNTSSGLFDGVFEFIASLIVAIPALLSWLVYFIVF